MFSISINSSDLNRLITAFNAGEKEIKKAMWRAVSRVTRWTKLEVARRISAVTGVSIRILRNRIRLDMIEGERLVGRVWYGLNPISLSRLNPRQNTFGVKAGPASVPGAFISKKGGLVFKRKGKARLPIEKQYYEINEKSALALERISEQVGERLLNEFTNELKWQTRVR